MQSPDSPADKLSAGIPRRSPISIVAPIGVIIATLLLIAWSAWPTIRPVRTVPVAQAVFLPVVTSEPVGSGESEPTASRQITVTVQAPGWLEAEPFMVACTALADGIVERIDVLEGDYVEAGQVVAYLVSDDSRLKLDRATAELAFATAEHSAALADHEAAQANWDNLVDRTRTLETTRAMLGEAEAEAARLPARVRSARATLERLIVELARTEQSEAAGAATEFEVTVARQGMIAQRALVEALEGERPLLEARVARARADLIAAERHMELRIEEQNQLAISAAAVERTQASVQSANVAVNEAQLELDRMTITAPISGYVQRRLKAPGDKVMRAMDTPHSAHLVHLYDPTRLQVRVDVPLADAAHIALGQRCEVVVEVLPDDIFNGEVLRITHEADLQKNTLQAKVRVDNPSPLLRPEMLTRVKFLPTESDDPRVSSPDTGAVAVSVPTSAIDTSQPVPRIWVITGRRADSGRATPIPIERMQTSGDRTIVSGAIAPGALVIVDQEIPQPGERVRFASRGDKS